MEMTGLEPVTFCLQSRHSTFELHPPCYAIKENLEFLVRSR